MPDKVALVTVVPTQYLVHMKVLHYSSILIIINIVNR